MRNFHLSRRAFLRGSGACLALPALEAMLPRRARAQATTKPLRFIVWTLPDGVRMDAWTPTQTGSGYTLTPILQPLAAIPTWCAYSPDVEVGGASPVTKSSLLALSSTVSVMVAADSSGEHGSLVLSVTCQLPSSAQFVGSASGCLLS